MEKNRLVELLKFSISKFSLKVDSFLFLRWWGQSPTIQERLNNAIQLEKSKRWLDSCSQKKGVSQTAFHPAHHFCPGDWIFHQHWQIWDILFVLQKAVWMGRSGIQQVIHYDSKWGPGFQQCFFRFITIVGVIGLFGEYIAVPLLSERFKFHDSSIALLDAATSCVNQFILAFAMAEYLVRPKDELFIFVMW